MPEEYKVLHVQDPETGYRARLIYEDDDPLVSWMSCARFDSSPAEPIVLQLQGTDEEDWVLGDLWFMPITVMSERLYEVLLQAGVDNLDTYAVELHDPVSGTVYDQFVAFNVIGAIAAADLSDTRFAPGIADRMISADIDSLAIDAAKTQGALMFRLAESVNTVLVHRSVVDVIEAAGIDTLTFIDPPDWAS